MKKLLAFTVLFFSSLTTAKEVQIEVYDCGPLGRGELGVVFSIGDHGSGQTYFAKGNAMDVCPKITEAKTISGHESNYCDNYTAEYPHECNAVKVFTITGYQYE